MSLLTQFPESKIYKRILNTPIIWTFIQDFFGSNQFKHKLYPSLVHGKGRILDFGCSVGNCTGDFLHFEYHGIDADKGSIAGAKKRWKGIANVEFHALDIIRDGYKKEYFDHVLFACTGHHLSDVELSKVFDALLSNLKAGGMMHFIDNIRQPGRDRLITRMLISMDQGKYVRSAEVYKEIFHGKKLNVEEIKIINSPDTFIKLTDMIYARIRK